MTGCVDYTWTERWIDVQIVGRTAVWIALSLPMYGLMHGLICGLMDRMIDG